MLELVFILNIPSRGINILTCIQLSVFELLCTSMCFEVTTVVSWCLGSFKSTKISWLTTFSFRTTLDNLVLGDISTENLFLAMIPDMLNSEHLLMNQPLLYGRCWKMLTLFEKTRPVFKYNLQIQIFKYNQLLEHLSNFSYNFCSLRNSQFASLQDSSNTPNQTAR